MIDMHEPLGASGSYLLGPAVLTDTPDTWSSPSLIWLLRDRPGSQEPDNVPVSTIRIPLGGPLAYFLHACENLSHCKGKGWSAKGLGLRAIAALHTERNGG
jgi:hypothetical protein